MKIIAINNMNSSRQCLTDRPYIYNGRPTLYCSLHITSFLLCLIVRKGALPAISADACSLILFLFSLLIRFIKCLLAY